MELTILLAAVLLASSISSTTAHSSFSPSPSPSSIPPASDLPFGPRTLGILEGFSSLPYDCPATRGEGFGQWLGWRPAFVNQALDFTHWSTWPSFFIDPFNKNSTNATITLQMPSMFPNTTWADAAAGKYNDSWYQTADVMCNVLHKCNVHLRPSWEMNGNWYPWSAALNLTAFIQYWRNIVSVIRTVKNQQFKVVWNPNALYQAGTPNCLNPPWLAYPGDEYVDIIAADLYDQDWAAYPPDWDKGLNSSQIQTRWLSQWTKYQTGLYGLDEFLTFALTHKKPLAIAEWGLKPSASHGGGDNILYIQRMYDWMTSPAVYPHLVYHSYYDEEDSTISRGPLNPKNTNFPNSAKLYQRLFGPSNEFWYSKEAQTAAA